IFLKWNLPKDVWNKIWNFQIHVCVCVCVCVCVWFTSLFICNEQFSKSVRSYCILYVINTSNIFYSSHKLSNYYVFFYEIHFQVLLKIGGTRLLYLN
ncbi:hypothetical protein ALC57_08306, partial [Trachymyrmex cornetzi]